MTSYPSNWKIESLDSLINRGIIKLNRGDIISKRDIAAHPGDYPIYSSAKENNGMFGRYGKYMFDEEVITWSIDGGGRLFYREKQKFSVTNVGGILRIIDKSVFDYKFLFYALTNLHSQVIFDWSRKAHPSVIRLVYDKVPIPPIDEQHKIVELLEDHLSRLDAALTDVKQAKIKAAQFRKSLLQYIFEGKYSPNSNNWEHRAIGDFAQVKGGKRLPKGTKWSEEPTRHPYIRATDIKLGKIKTEGLVHVPDSVWKSISRYVVEENDVVITIAGTIGEIAVVPSDLAGANLTENAAKLVFDHEYVLPSFLSMYLQSPSVQQELKDLSKATTQAKLALYRIATVEIPVPTLHEQQEIMELVEEKLTYLISSLNQIADVELHIASLRRSLLQAAFTGQLTKEVVSV